MKTMKKDIHANEQITTFFALESMRLRTSKNKNNFLELTLQDKTGRIKGYLWNDPVITAATLKEKSIVKVRAMVSQYNDSLILNVEKIRQANKDEFEIQDFMEVVAGGIEQWLIRLRELTVEVKETNCQMVINRFLEDQAFMNLFTSAPGGVSIHHGYAGGLLEHTVMIMGQGLLLAEKHPGLLDKDLLLTGAFIHDIGKTRELGCELTREYTTEGKLMGHIVIGILMLEEKISKISDFPDDLALLLKHMILSHHGELEFGSPIRPATPEAITLNLLDNADAKINHIYRQLGYSNPDDMWSGFDKILKTELYQKRYVKQQAKSQKEVTV
jgi:3'-5' exoribonuclease